MLLKLDIIPSGDKQSHMSFESLASIMLAVAAIVVGVVLPLAGIFAFGFLRSDVKHKTEEFMANEIQKGKFHKQVEDAINSALKDEDGVLRQYINSSVTGAVEARIAVSQIEAQNTTTLRKQIEWGNEADEHGDLPRPRGKES